MIIPRQIFGWHGHGTAKIIQQDGEHIVLDLSCWINSDGYGEWKEGITLELR